MDAVATGKWKQRPATVSVVSASVTNATNDVTKALSLMCNGVETCSVPAATIIPRLGTDARLTAPAVLDVSYTCAGDATVYSASFAPGKDAVLTCNIRRAVAGVYVNTSHDANPGRGPEDTVLVADAPQASTDLRQGLWTWTPSNATQPTATLFNYGVDLSELQLYWGSLAEVQWGEEGHPLRIKPWLAVERPWFDWTAPAVETLPVVPQP
jgi:hypothetical protein